MDVHEVVTQAVHYVNGNLLTEPPEPYDATRIREMLDRGIAEGGGWFNHQRLLKPPEGRQREIWARMGPLELTLVHPNRASADDLQVGRRERVTELCFRDPDGLEVEPIDLCISVFENKTQKSSAYVASQGGLYAVRTLSRSELAARPKDERLETVGVVEIGDEEALDIAFHAVRAVIKMPVSVRGIKREQWLMQTALSQGTTGTALRTAERALWLVAQAKEAHAPEPPDTHPLFPGARKIGHGWEWVAYLLPDGKTVEKVPRGVFPEIAEPGYLFAAKDAYDACTTFIPQFTAKTSFERRGDTNILHQEYLPRTPIEGVDPARIPLQQRRNFRAFGEGLITLLEKHAWSPDLWLQRSANGLWGMKNVILVGNTPTLYDFTAIYDDYRLSPDRMKEEVTQMNALLRTLVEDMS